jgi:hypothetical protein
LFPDVPYDAELPQAIAASDLAVVQSCKAEARFWGDVDRSQRRLEVLDEIDNKVSQARYLTFG